MRLAQRRAMQKLTPRQIIKLRLANCSYDPNWPRWGGQPPHLKGPF